MDGTLPKRKSGIQKKNASFWGSKIRREVTEFIHSQAQAKPNAKNRKDNYRKEVIRFVFKIPRVILDMVGTRNKFCRDKLRDNAFAYWEAFYGFARAFKFDLTSWNLLRSYIEFIILYFPRAKVQNILTHIERGGHSEFSSTLALYFSQRDKKSLKHVKNWLNDSQVLRTLFTFTQSVVEDLQASEVVENEGNESTSDQPDSSSVTSISLINKFINELL